MPTFHFVCGDAVRVRAGVLDPFMVDAVRRGEWGRSIDLGGWQGVVVVVANRDGRQRITIEWDSHTLTRIPVRWLHFWAAERCDDERFGFATFDAPLLEPDTIRDTPEDRAAERRSVQRQVTWVMATDDLHIAVGAPAVLMRGIDITWSFLIKRDYLPSFPDAVDDEVEGEAFQKFIDGRRLTTVPGSLRVDGRLMGKAATYRCMQEARHAGFDVLRVIASWCEDGHYFEQDAVAAIQPWSVPPMTARRFVSCR